MIFGTAKIVDGSNGRVALETSNDNYPLTPNTNISVLRPFRALGLGLAVLLTGFGIAFRDILYTHELWIIAGGVLIAFLVGNILAHLVLINRELNGSDLSVAVWGTYRHLNRLRKDLAAARDMRREGIQ